MPSTCCCVPKCSNRGGHVFPKNEKLRKKWIKAMRRNANKNKFQYWKPSKSRVVCKMHFKESDYISETTCGTTTLVKRLNKDAVPSVFPWNDSTSKSDDRALRQSKRQTIQQELESDTSSDSDTIEHEENECDISNVGNEILYCAEKIDSPKMENPESAETTSYTLHNDSGTQTQSWPSLCVETFEDDQAGMMFYTGLLLYYDFKFVLDSLGEVVYNLNYMYYRSEQLSVENQFFFTLIKLRQHMINFELSRLFNISEPAVSNIWITWINFMASQWKEINVWPEQDVVRFFSPQDFKRQFPTTRVIIDGTECPVKKQKSPIAQQSTFSTYKNRNTIKLLVGATPGGLVSFISTCFCGSTSDRQMCERSALSTLCDSGDSVMADKGFNVQDLFAPSNVTINIPTFFS